MFPLNSLLDMLLLVAALLRRALTQQVCKLFCSTMRNDGFFVFLIITVFFTTQSCLNRGFVQDVDALEFSHVVFCVMVLVDFFKLLHCKLYKVGDGLGHT